MIYLGPAGVPTVSKDKSTLGGIKTVSELKLNAMEIEFVRGVKMSNELAKQAGKLAKELGVRLSVHAPYFVNLSSLEKEKVEASKKRILDSMEKASLMNADVVCVHAGYYGKLSEEETYQKIKEACEDIVEKAKSKGWETILALETTGKVSQFGTIDEIVNICKEVKGCGIVVDVAHIFARQAGRINYVEIFDKLKPLKLKHYNFHFSGIKFSPVGVTGKGNERFHLPIKVNSPPLEPLVKEILKRKINATLISESPVLEKDALVLKHMFEKHGYKF